MLRVTINRSYFATLQDRVTQLQAEFDVRLSDVLDRHGLRLTDAMQANHEANAHEIERYVNRTYSLTPSIGFTLEAPMHFADVVKHRIVVFAAAAYAYDVEFGVPGRSQPYPFFWIEVNSPVQEEAGLLEAEDAVEQAVMAVSNAP